MLSVYPNFIFLISKFLPYFIGQNPLGENLWAAAGVMPGYVETIHILGIWPLASDFRAALPDGSFKVLGAIALIAAGILIGRAPRPLQGLSLVGLVLYFGLSFTGTYLNFKALALGAPLVSFAIYCSIFNLVHPSNKVLSFVVGVALLSTVLFSYQKALPSFHRNNIVSKSQIDDFLALKKLYIDKNNVLLLDKMEFASYIIDDLSDFSPLTNYLHRPWPGTTVNMVIVNRNYRDIAKGYLTQQKMLLPGSGEGPASEANLILQRPCRVSHFKEWDIYRICY
jgi:hypothetical protein